MYVTTTIKNIYLYYYYLISYCYYAVLVFLAGYFEQGYWVHWWLIKVIFKLWWI